MADGSINREDISGKDKQDMEREERSWVTVWDIRNCYGVCGNGYESSKKRLRKGMGRGDKKEV